jgi:hypothetical protein
MFINNKILVMILRFIPYEIDNLQQHFENLKFILFEITPLKIKVLLK